MHFVSSLERVHNANYFYICEGRRPKIRIALSLCHIRETASTQTLCHLAGSSWPQNERGSCKALSR